MLQLDADLDACGRMASKMQPEAKQPAIEGVENRPGALRCGRRAAQRPDQTAYNRWRGDLCSQQSVACFLKRPTTDSRMILAVDLAPFHSPSTSISRRPRSSTALPVNTPFMRVQAKYVPASPIETDRAAEYQAEAVAKKRSTSCGSRVRAIGGRLFRKACP